MVHFMVYIFYHNLKFKWAKDLKRTFREDTKPPGHKP